MTFSFYGDSAYSIVYNIIKPYKNFLNWPRTAAYNQFNKTISKLQIKVKYSFAIHQNF